MKQTIHYLFVAAAATTLLLAGGCAAPPESSAKEPAPDFTAPLEFEPIAVEGLKPAQVSAETIKPGLDALYYIDFFKRDLTALPKGKSTEYHSFRKKPIQKLDHQFGQEPVFDSNSNRGVGMRMTGFLHFPENGVYELQALSNDGILLYLDDQLVLSDPKQHSDRMSNLGLVTIDTGGWYPLEVEYFQRKGTATLRLFWKKPGASDQEVVPASAYGH